MDYIRNRLGHEGWCRYFAAGSDERYCNCERKEALARIEAMEAFVEAYRYAAHVRSGAHAHVTIVLAERAVDDAFAKLEGE